ncbi:biotin--[acetyl-CoA-carboxylase] ligase [Cytophagaceae bacterium ABcell3]|nr:biotin--[acetyl-CoA-carboxylase] ligase [Cytophagaceae bacterium ABcell3]
MKECRSTNALMVEKLSAPLPEGTVLITSCQTAGQGQRGSSWEAEPDKNLTFSLLLKPSFLPISDQFYLNMVICLAISDTLTQYTSKKVTIKWPNDIYVEAKKICGILINNFLKGCQFEHVVVGIGLNVNQENFQEPKAVSLKMIEQKEVNLVEVLEILLGNIEKWYLALMQKKYKNIQENYLSKMFRINEKHLYRSDGIFEGTIRGIDPTGKLAVETEVGIRYFCLKEIEYVM